ncbi:MAG: response regulator transcription factor [Ardenticatenia bacterium]|nr:response regulator transcription factor [Ardenticatenia bacterium]
MVVDDHEVVRLGLKGLLERQPGWYVVAEAAAAGEAVRRAVENRPDVIVMDIRLAGSSGIDACRQIIQQIPDTRVIMLTSYAEDGLLFDAIAAGAAGYVLKQIGSDDLVRAIETVSHGEALLDPGLTSRVLARVREATRKEALAAFADLTEQEIRVLSLIAEGKTNREIAEVLYLGDGTVRNYVSNILSKLGVSNRAEAAAYAVQHNLKIYTRDT